MESGPSAESDCRAEVLEQIRRTLVDGGSAIYVTDHREYFEVADSHIVPFPGRSFRIFLGGTSDRTYELAGERGDGGDGELTSDDRGGAMRVAWGPTWRKTREWFTKKLETELANGGFDQCFEVAPPSRTGGRGR